MSLEGRYESEEAGVVAGQCGLCRHPRGGVCPAFAPAPIPDAILTNRFDHRGLYPGQADPSVLFDPRRDADAGAVRRLTAVLDAL